MLSPLPNVLDISSPVTLAGDLHGQFQDLLELFRVGGPVPETSYVFLGDYVDRGSQSVEVITLLCLLKLLHPSRIHLVRGNHESRQLTQNYGFYMECMAKYSSPKVWHSFVDLFDHFLLGVRVDSTFLCVHGGLSPQLPLLS